MGVELVVSMQGRSLLRKTVFVEFIPSQVILRLIRATAGGIE